MRRASLLLVLLIATVSLVSPRHPAVAQCAGGGFEYMDSTMATQQSSNVVIGYATLDSSNLMATINVTESIKGNNPSTIRVTDNNATGCLNGDVIVFMNGNEVVGVERAIPDEVDKVRKAAGVSAPLFSTLGSGNKTLIGGAIIGGMVVAVGAILIIAIRPAKPKQR